MNYIILFASAYIMKIKVKQYRLIVSSSIGSVFVVLEYTNNIRFFSNFAIKIILSIVIVLTAYNPIKFKIFFKEIIYFYLISFVFGGCAFFLLYFIKPQNIFIKNGVYVGKYAIKVTLLGGIVGFIVAHIAFNFVKGKITKRDIIAQISIFYNKKQINLRALVDTGNLLKDPISGFPVIVVCKDNLYSIFPNEILENTDKIIDGTILIDTIIKDEEITKIRMIPFSSLGKQNGVLIGIKVDKIQICFDETDTCVKNAIIGIYDKQLSKKNEYGALIRSRHIEGV